MPKKVLAQDFRNQPSAPMSPSYTHTLNANASVAGVATTSLGDEDEDDICPVCESECTCRNRNPSSSTIISPSASRSIATLPMRTSTYTSTSYSPPKPAALPSTNHHQLQPQQSTQPLKIKLTVPPNLKFRKNLAATGGNNGSSAAAAARNSASTSGVGRGETASTSATMPQQVALSILDPSGPKRRGRPPKAVVAAREAAKAALASAHASYGGSSGAGARSIPRKGTHVTVTSSSSVKARPQGFAGSNNRKSLTTATYSAKTSKKAAGKRALTALSTSYSSEDETQYPTFMSAASTSSLTSSSESQTIDSSESSTEEDESDADDKVYYDGHGRVKRELTGDDPAQKRRDHASSGSGRWEIKPRKQSVDPEEYGMDADSEDTSGGEDNADDEDDSEDEDDEEDEDEEENGAEADVEEEGLAEVEEEPEMGEADGKLGVSFGTSWSEDEESSFDADLFFANLDDSTDSDGSPAALRLDSFESEMDADSGDCFSGDEADALLLMDMDPSVQVRRSVGEFEVGVELDGLTLGVDGQLLLPASFHHFPAFEGSLDDSHASDDVDMTQSQDGSTTEDDDGSDSEGDGVILQESDGETTEDELIDANGLPNSKAMMLFRWPAPLQTSEQVSTVDPLSTVSHSSSEEAQDHSQPSRTLRMALASMQAHQGSPAFNSMDEYDEAEMGNIHETESLRMYEDDSGRTPGVPVMGQFVTDGNPVQQRHVIIDGNGTSVPSPFPRSKRSKKRSKAKTDGHNFNTDAKAHQFSFTMPFVAIQPPSSDEFGSQSHAQTSDDPSSTEAIDLDDVLDASFLDSEPSMFDLDAPQSWLTPSTPTASTPLESLHRWDRIPVGTFRRTRETSLLESTPGSDSGLANLYPAISALLNNDMLGTPKSKGSKLKNNSRNRSKNGTSSTLVISPVLLPVRDGDRTPTGSGHPLYNPFSQNGHHTHQQHKSRKELRKEKAMMKRKMIGKQGVHPPSRNHHRHHYPNMKSRGTSSVQRTQFASSSHVPHLSL